MLKDKLLVAGPGVGVVVMGVIGHIAILSIAVVGVGVVVVSAGAVAIVNVLEDDAKIIKKREKGSNKKVLPLEARVEALESKDKERVLEIESMRTQHESIRQEIDKLKNNARLADQADLASRRRAVNGFFTPSEPSNDSNISAGVDNKPQMSGIKQ